MKHSSKLPLRCHEADQRSRTARSVSSATSPLPPLRSLRRLGVLQGEAGAPMIAPMAALGTQSTLAGPSAQWTPRVSGGHMDPFAWAWPAWGPRRLAGVYGDPTPLQKPPLATLGGSRV